MEKFCGLKLSRSRFCRRRWTRFYEAGVFDRSLGALVGDQRNSFWRRVFVSRVSWHFYRSAKKRLAAASLFSQHLAVSWSKIRSRAFSWIRPRQNEHFYLQSCESVRSICDLFSDPAVRARV